MGLRGDAIVQFDYCVGEILNTLEKLGLRENTLIILSSDNGPVVDDGYDDKAEELLNGHSPAGPLRGNKYSAFEGGTRIPAILSWPKEVKKGTTSDLLVSHVDWLASLASLTVARQRKERPSVGNRTSFQSYTICPHKRLEIYRTEWGTENDPVGTENRNR